MDWTTDGADSAESAHDMAQTEAVDDSRFDLGGELYHRESATNDGTTATESDAWGASATVDYPGSWMPDSWTGDSEVTVEGEISRSESTTLDHGAATDTTTWGGGVSVDY